MSNDASIAVVKTSDAFYAELIFGRSNLTSKVAQSLLASFQMQNKPQFASAFEAMNEAKEMLQDFVLEHDCYPVYGIEKLDWTSYAK